MKNPRTLLFRLGTVVILLGIAAVMMIIGRGHTVYLDNKTMEYDGVTYESSNRIVVYVGGERIARLASGDRGMSTCIGQSFTMELAITEVKDGEEVTSTHTIKLPYNLDGIVINLPTYLAGLPEEAYLSEFVSMAIEEPVEEEVVIDEFAIGLEE